MAVRCRSRKICASFGAPRRPRGIGRARAGGATGWIAPSLGLLFAIDVPTGGGEGGAAGAWRSWLVRVRLRCGVRAVRSVSDLKTRLKQNVTTSPGTGPPATKSTPHTTFCHRGAPELQLRACSLTVDQIWSNNQKSSPRILCPLSRALPRVAPPLVARFRHHRGRPQQAYRTRLWRAPQA